MSMQARLNEQIAELNAATDRINAGLRVTQEQLATVRTELETAKAVIAESAVDATVLDALTAAVDNAQATADALEPAPPVDAPVLDETPAVEEAPAPEITEPVEVVLEAPVEGTPAEEAPVAETVAPAEEVVAPVVTDEVVTESTDTVIEAAAEFTGAVVSPTFTV